MKVVFSSMVLLILHSLKTAKGQSRAQVLDLYSQPNSIGEHVKLPQTYVANLADLNFDDQARSICATGIWLLYEDKVFNPAGQRGADYIFGRDNDCANLMVLSGEVSSVRYAGDPKDYKTDSLTLYEHNYFQGSEEYVSSQNPSLSLNKGFGSIIITGKSPWTIFDQSDYKGKSTCLLGPDSANSTPLLIYDIASDEHIEFGTIKSVRKGCVNRHEEGKFGVQ